jgi:hypothetical protein
MDLLKSVRKVPTVKESQGWGCESIIRWGEGANSISKDINDETIGTIVTANHNTYPLYPFK